MTFLFSLPVWGDYHIDLFNRVGLPSLLAPGNLGVLGEDAQFVIHTRPQDIERVRGTIQATLFAAGVVNVVRPIPPHEAGDKYAVMSACHREAVALARGNAAVVFPLADHVWAAGSLLRMRQIADDGKRVIHLAAFRTLADAWLDWPLTALMSRPKGFSGRQLVSFGLGNLHPAARAHLWNDKAAACGHPSNLYWEVGRDGLLAHCFHLHPLMVRPGRAVEWSGTIDDDFVMTSCPDLDDHYVVQDSDDICALELSPPHDPRVDMARRCAVEGVRGWMMLSANPLHRRLVRLPIRFHAGEIAPRLWGHVEAKARAVLDEIFILDDRKIAIGKEPGEGGMVYVCTDGTVAVRSPDFAGLIAAINAETRFRFTARRLQEEELEINDRHR